MRTWKPALVALLLLSSSTLHAQVDENAQRALARAQFMLRQVSGEKSALEQQLAELQKRVDQLQGELSSSRSEATAKQAALSKQLAGSQQQWRSDREQLGGEITQARAESARQRQMIAELEERLEIQTGNFTQCHANNHKLYEINRELLARYEGKGAVDALVQKEPFTGLSQVQVENLVQDYRYRLEDLKLPDTQDGAGGSEGAR